MLAFARSRHSLEELRKSDFGRILPINPATTVDRSVIWPLSAPRLPAPGPSAGKTFAHELVPKRLTTPNDDPKFASKPIFITISDWSNLERAFVQ